MMICTNIKYYILFNRLLNNFNFSFVFPYFFRIPIIVIIGTYVGITIINKTVN